MESSSAAHGTQAPITVGENIELHRADKKLVIIIDLSQTGTPSSSGKTTVIGSTRGNVPVPNATGLYLGVNLFGYDGFTVDDA